MHTWPHPTRRAKHPCAKPHLQSVFYTQGKVAASGKRKERHVTCGHGQGVRIVMQGGSEGAGCGDEMGEDTDKTLRMRSESLSG